MLRQKQKRNLLFLENWAEMPKVEGVPILKAFTYELIQVLNHLTIQELTANE